MKRMMLTVAALMMVSALAYAAPMVDPTSGFEVTIPDTWQMVVDETGASTGLMAADPNGEVLVILYPEVAADAAAAGAGLDAFLATVVEAPVVVEPLQEIELNGLPGLSAGGTGTVDGTEVVWGVGGVVNVTTGYALLVCIVADAATAPAHEAEITALIASIGAPDGI